MLSRKMISSSLKLTTLQKNIYFADLALFKGKFRKRTNWKFHPHFLLRLNFTYKRSAVNYDYIKLQCLLSTKTSSEGLKVESSTVVLEAYYELY